MGLGRRVFYVYIHAPRGGGVGVCTSLAVEVQGWVRTPTYATVRRVASAQGQITCTAPVWDEGLIQMYLPKGQRDKWMKGRRCPAPRLDRHQSLGTGTFPPPSIFRLLLGELFDNGQTLSFRTFPLLPSPPANWTANCTRDKRRRGGKIRRRRHHETPLRLCGYQPETIHPGRDEGTARCIGSLDGDIQHEADDMNLTDFNLLEALSSYTIDDYYTAPVEDYGEDGKYGFT